MKQNPRPKEQTATKGALEAPVLRRLGTLRELTLSAPGKGNDGGSGHFSFP